MFSRFPMRVAAPGSASIPLPHIMAAISSIGSNGWFSSANGNGKHSALAEAFANTDAPTPQGVQSRIDMPKRTNLRVALYSHDTMGLGHLRRNLVIASALADSAMHATNLLVTGAHEANFFSLPSRSDFLTLPRLHKNVMGSYSAGNLDISVKDLISLRADSIYSALLSFRPDLLIVDKVPYGAFGELVPTLKTLRMQGNVKCVLGIRDVLDDPAVVQADTDNELIREAVDQFYDEIWIYGDQRVYDPIQEYNWPKSVAAKVRFTGYLDQSQRLRSSPDQCMEKLLPTRRSPSERLLVCTLGGGQDGFEVAQAFVESMPKKGAQGVLLTGPFMPKQEAEYINQLASACPNLMVREFSSEADLLVSRADSVVTMGGYNSVCSVLSYGKRALVVPRVAPRKEQLIRAERLARLGLIDMLHPQHLAGNCMRDWLAEAATPTSCPVGAIDMNGLTRLEEYSSQLVKNSFTKTNLTPRNQNDHVR